MIGERIEQLRKARGLTLAELGEKIGVAASTVQKWETGQIRPSRRTRYSSSLWNTQQRTRRRSSPGS